MTPAKPQIAKSKPHTRRDYARNVGHTSAITADPSSSQTNQWTASEHSAASVGAVCVGEVKQWTK